MILYFLSFIGIGIGILFAVYSVATGLYYISELVEEYSVITKKLLFVCCLTIISIQVLMLFENELPISNLFYSIFCSCWHYRLVEMFPFIAPSDPIFIISCLLSTINHFIWFYHFKSGYWSVEELTSFFGIIVWFLPFCFIISLSANDSTLPHVAPSNQKNKSVFKNLLHFILYPSTAVPKKLF